MSEHEVVGLERAALDRWGRGDPSGYLEISAPEVTYFDPFVAQRVDGREALAAYYAPIRGTIRIMRYEMPNVRVDAYGDTAILTFDLVSYGGTDEGMRWHCTEVYVRRERWEIVQTHWSRPAA